MQCAEYESRVGHLLYNLVSREERDALRAHAETCPRCRGRSAGLEQRVCREILDILDDYVAGEMSDDELRHFEAHLSVCEPCIAYIESYRATVELTRGAYAERAVSDLPPDLVQAILDLRNRHGDR